MSMFELKNEKKYIKMSLLIICSLFLFLCIFSSLKYGDYNLLGSYEKMNNDDVKYIRSAWTLIDTGRFTYHDPAEPTAFIMPGLPFVLAFFMTIFGKFGGIIAFRLFQGVIQTLSILIIFFIGRKLFNSKIGLIAALIDALYIPEIWSTNIILTEAMFKFLLVLLIYICIYAIDTKKTKYYMWGGAVWGITALFRPTISAFPAVVLIMWFHKKYKLQEMIKYTAITTAVFCAVMSPWWIRNYIAFDRFIPLTLSSGNPLIQGSYINYDESIDYYPWTSVDDRIEQEHYYKENVKYRFKHYMLKRPGAYAKWYFIDKTKELWNAPFYWREIFKVNVYLAGLYHYIIMISSFIGAVFYFKDIRSKKLDNMTMIIFWIIAFFAVIHIPYVTFSRYGYPVMAMFILLSSYAIDKLYIKVKDKKSIKA